MWTITFKSSLRYLWKQKGYTSILVFGLALGLAASFLILLWATDELSYDTFHQHADSIHIVLVDEHYPDNVQSFAETPGPLAATLKRDYPEIVNATRIKYTQDFLVNFGDFYFVETKILGVDPSFLNMFDFPLVIGNAEQALENPNNILITQNIAQKYFGNNDPIGQTLHIDPEFDFVVTGVLHNLPHNSLFDFEFLVPITTFMIRYSAILDNWDIPDVSATYIQLADGASAEEIIPKIKNLIQDHSEAENISLRLFPLTQIHTHPESAPISGVSVSMSEIYTYLGVALLILIIAIINFMNLTTARFGQRLKEIGVKKVVGATRLHLSLQFILEALLLTTISFILAVILFEVLLPLLNQISGKSFDLLMMHNIKLLVLFFALTLLTGLVAGSYPAGFLGRFNPTSILKNKIMLGHSNSRIRQGLVVFQFTLSILFILGTIIVYQQLIFMKNYDAGYDRDNLISVPLAMHWGHREDGTFYETLKKELLDYPGVLGVTQSFQAPGDVITSAGEANWEGKPEDQSVLMNWLTVHYDFFKVLDIPVIEGRSFSKEFAGDMSTWDGGAYVINETAARLMGTGPHVGKWFEHYSKRGQIIGVVKDFNFRSLKKGITPLAMFVHPFYNHALLIKIRPEDKQATLTFIKETWDKHAHNYPFSYTFVDDELNQVYLSEQRSGTLLNSFAFFALIIACLGLLGLSSFSIQQKTREIGIRKVLGSSMQNIWTLLTLEYTKAILIAILFAWPLSWYLLTRWLNSYAYRVNLTVWPFLVSGLVALGIALLTVSWQTARAAAATPVKALRYE